MKLLFWEENLKIIYSLVGFSLSQKLTEWIVCLCYCIGIFVIAVFADTIYKNIKNRTVQSYVNRGVGVAILFFVIENQMLVTNETAIP